jgi:hypothetical protein
MVIGHYFRAFLPGRRAYDLASKCFFVAPTANFTVYFKLKFRALLPSVKAVRPSVATDLTFAEGAMKKRGAVV